MTILGAKRSKGVLDNGVPYDSTKLYIQTPMAESADQIGYAAAEYAWGTSENFYRLQGLSFPLTAQVIVEAITNGKTTKLAVTHVELPKAPVQAPKPNN